jgi:hypothetical protein
MANPIRPKEGCGSFNPRRCERFEGHSNAIMPAMFNDGEILGKQS